MAVFVSRPTDFSPSLFDDELISFKNDDDYINDPDQTYDPLPQPFRMINKVLNIIYDTAWREISLREQDRLEEASKIHAPLFTCDSIAPECVNISCMQSSPDGLLLFVGRTSGVTVIDSVTKTVRAHWVALAEVISQLQVVQINESVYLVSAINDSGKAKLLGFQDKHLFELCQMNGEKDAFDEDSKKNIATKCELSQDGYYVAISLETNENCSVEFYKTPLESWIKEIESGVAKMDEHVAAQMQIETPREDTQNVTAEGNEAKDIHRSRRRRISASIGRRSVTSGRESSHKFHMRTNTAMGIESHATGGLTLKFSSCTLILRVPPPKPVTGISWISAYQLSKSVDSGDVVGQGNNHLLSLQNLEHRWESFCSQYPECAQLADTAETKDGIVKQPRFHFLKPNRFLPDGNQDMITNAIVWWTNISQLSYYSLIKSFKDVEHQPDVVWPLASHPLCSEITPCSQILAVVFENANVVIWNLKLGLVHRIIHLDLDPGCFVTHLTYVDTNNSLTWQHQEVLGNLCVQGMFVALSNNGTAYRLPLEHSLTTSQMNIGSGKASESFICISPISDFSKLLLAVTLNGRVVVHDITATEGDRELFEVTLAPAYRLANQWSPVIAVAGETLAIKGESKPTEMEKPQSSLFSLSLQSTGLLSNYLQKTFTERTLQSKSSSAEKRINTLLASRIESQNCRSNRQKARWSVLHKEIDSIKNACGQNNSVTTFTAPLSVASIPRTPIFDDQPKTAYNSARSPDTRNKVLKSISKQFNSVISQPS